MTERRNTLTLNWRPAGQPARRVDDFAQVAYVPPQATRKTDELRPDMGVIHERLQNWARWANAEYRIINRSPTAVHCDRLRREAGQEIAFADERRKIDEDDAYLIERSLFQLTGTQTKMLRMFYAEGRRWQPICRVLQFPVRQELFESMLANAQQAIEVATRQYRR